MINFKDRIKRQGAQQQNPQSNSQWPQQTNLNTNLNRTNSRKDLYKQVTNQLSSQQFEAGDFRRNEQMPLAGHKKRNSILQMQCEEDIQIPQVQQQYYATDRPRSMINSNVGQNYNGSLFQSKLHETKGELCEQIVDLQRRIKRQIDRDRNLIEDYLNRLFTKYGQKSKEQQKKNFDLIVSQLNKNLSLTSKKQKSLESSLTEQGQKLMQLSKQFSQYTLETEQKIEKIMNSNSNADAGTSMKKSFSRNMGNGDYIVELKSSIKDIPVVSNQLVDDIRGEMHEVQEALRLLKFEVTHVKEDFNSKALRIVQAQKSKPETVELSKFNILAQQINSIKMTISSLQTQEQSRTKYRQLHNILQIQQQNYIGINDAFQKTINTNILPRLKKQEQILVQSTGQRVAQTLKKQIIKELESMPIIRIKHISQEQKQKIERMKQLSTNQQLIYMMDQNNYILDCFGCYLVDQANQKIKLVDEQIYYLQNFQGVQVGGIGG